MQNKQRVIRVLQIGPSIKAPGGISAVIVNLLEAQANDPEIASKAIPTSLCGLHGQWVDVLMFLVAYLRIVRACLQRPKPLLHIHLASRGSAVRKGIIVRTARRLGVKCLGHDHSVRFLYEVSGKRMQRWVEGTLRQCHMLITLSNNNRPFLQSHTQAPVRSVPNAVTFVDPAPRLSRNVEGPASFLFLGNDMKRKGCPDLMKAFDMLCDWDVPAKLILAGVDCEDEVRDWIARRGHGDRVRLPGWVTGDKKAEVLGEADVLVLPSYREGLPVAILEAMACSLPVIATPVGAVEDAVKHGETGLIVQAGDVKGLAEAMKRLALDPQLRHRMGEVGRDLVGRDFTLERIAQRVKDVYLELAG